MGFIPIKKKCFLSFTFFLCNDPSSTNAIRAAGAGPRNDRLSYPAAPCCTSCAGFSFGADPTTTRIPYVTYQTGPPALADFVLLWRPGRRTQVSSTTTTEKVAVIASK